MHVLDFQGKKCRMLAFCENVRQNGIHLHICDKNAILRERSASASKCTFETYVSLCLSLAFYGSPWGSFQLWPASPPPHTREIPAKMVEDR